nr:toprim domain-containing protein [Mucilaginibacter sp. L294]
MENVRKRLSCAEANKKDLVDYLATIGFEPVKIRGNDHWYLSPFRDEYNPSFKIDRRINKWFDHGEGKGGNLIDFGLMYFKCTIPELLEKISGIPSYQQPLKKAAKINKVDDDNHILITGIKPLMNPALLQYAQSRSIPDELIKKYCEEVNYTNGGKNYFAIGFKNDLGGYELRSKYFKGSSSPKGITYINSGHNNLSVFEGFFNFLSFQKHFQNNGLPKTDFLILNSLSFFEQARPIMETYKETNLYLDNNVAGQKFASHAQSISPIYKDKSSLYTGHEDLNDFLVSQSKEVIQSPQKKRGLKL